MAARSFRGGRLLLIGVAVLAGCQAQKPAKSDSIAIGACVYNSDCPFDQACDGGE